MTTRDIITAALRKLEVIGAGVTPNGNDEAICREALNLWLDSLGTDPLSLYAITRTVHNLVDGQQDYTIGAGAGWSQPRPQQIDSASIILDPTATNPVEMPLGVSMTRAEWQAIAVKNLTSTYPSRYYYDQDIDTNGYGVVRVYPIPDTSTPDFVVYARQQMSQVTEANIAAELVLPPGYARMLIYNLAVEVASEFGLEPSGSVQNKAMMALAEVRKANWRPGTLRFPKVFGTRARFNIYTGS